MMVWLRLAWTATALAFVTLPMAAYQFAAFRTGWLDMTRAPKLWYALAARILRFRIKVIGDPPYKGALLLVSNHVSWTDIIVIGSHIRGSFIAKAEVAGWPVIGPLSRLQGTVLVDRAKKGSAAHQVEDLAAGLRAGLTMVLFAEGTTSDGTIMLPFKSTLFAAPRAAMNETQAPAIVQPLSIAYTRMGNLVMDRRLRGRVAWTGDEGLWQHLKRLLSFNPIDVELRFGAPMHFAASTDRKTITKAVEMEVRALFAASLSGHPVEPVRESR